MHDIALPMFIEEFISLIFEHINFLETAIVFKGCESLPHSFSQWEKQSLKKSISSQFATLFDLLQAFLIYSGCSGSDRRIGTHH
jgi:hypothetical protein